MRGQLVVILINCVSFTFDICKHPLQMKQRLVHFVTEFGTPVSWACVLAMGRLLELQR